MSTIATTNLKNPSSATNNITLASTGAVAINGAMTGGGLDLITPTSIAYSGGAASVLGGQIGFAGVSSISVNGCWTSSYANYIIAINYQSGIVNDYLGFRLRVSGSDNSTNNYFYGIAEQNFDASTLAARTNEASATRARIAFTGTVGNRAGTVLQMMEPQIAAHTIWNTQVTSGTKGMFGGGDFLSTTQFDGFTVYSEGASTITGSIRIYGYKNS